jgi:hypothetical protein
MVAVCVQVGEFHGRAVAILARQDLKGAKMGRMLLFFIGLVLTFNLGRDITLITLYPFLFGYLMLTIWGQVNGER